MMMSLMGFSHGTYIEKLYLKIKAEVECKRVVLAEVRDSNHEAKNE